MNELQKQIKEQENKNIKLFKIFQYRMQDKEMQPIIQEWREGCKKLRILNNKLEVMELKERAEKLINEDNKKEIMILINNLISTDMLNFLNNYCNANKKLSCFESEEQVKEEKTFINGYGEATKKYITSSTYERAERRRQKEIISFLGR